MRVGVIRDWDANGMQTRTLLNTYTKIYYPQILIQEIKEASVSNIQIERAANRVIASVHTAKPGMVIGKGVPKSMQSVELSKLTGKKVFIML